MAAGARRWTRACRQTNGRAAIIPTAGESSTRFDRLSGATSFRKGADPAERCARKPSPSSKGSFRFQECEKRKFVLRLRSSFQKSKRWERPNSYPNPPSFPLFQGGIFLRASLPSLAKRGRGDFWMI